MFQCNRRERGYLNRSSRPRSVVEGGTLAHPNTEPVDRGCLGIFDLEEGRDFKGSYDPPGPTRNPKEPLPRWTGVSRERNVVDVSPISPQSLGTLVSLSPEHGHSAYVTTSLKIVTASTSPVSVYFPTTKDKRISKRNFSFVEE